MSERVGSNELFVESHPCSEYSALNGRSGRRRSDGVETARGAPPPLCPLPLPAPNSTTTTPTLFLNHVVISSTNCSHPRELPRYAQLLPKPSQPGPFLTPLSHHQRSWQHAKRRFASRGSESWRRASCGSNCKSAGGRRASTTTRSAITSRQSTWTCCERTGCVGRPSIEGVGANRGRHTQVEGFIKLDFSS